jgi:uncharacterized protein YihD (DUF1040 family)
LTSFTKIFSRKTERELNYTTSESALAELQVLAKQKGWAIVRITDEHVIFKLKTREKETEFRIPHEQLV